MICEHCKNDVNALRGYMICGCCRERLSDNAPTIAMLQREIATRDAIIEDLRGKVISKTVRPGGRKT